MTKVDYYLMNKQTNKENYQPKIKLSYLLECRTRLSNQKPFDYTTLCGKIIGQIVGDYLFDHRAVAKEMFNSAVGKREVRFDKYQVGHVIYGVKYCSVTQPFHMVYRTLVIVIIFMMGTKYDCNDSSRNHSHVNPGPIPKLQSYLVPIIKIIAIISGPPLYTFSVIGYFQHDRILHISITEFSRRAGTGREPGRQFSNMTENAGIGREPGPASRRTLLQTSSKTDFESNF